MKKIKTVIYKIKSFLNEWCVKIFIPILSFILLLQGNIFLSKQIDIQNREVAAVPNFYKTETNDTISFHLIKEKGFMSNASFDIYDNILIRFSNDIEVGITLFYKRINTSNDHNDIYTFQSAKDIDLDRFIKMIEERFSKSDYTKDYPNIWCEKEKYYKLIYTDYNNDFKEMLYTRNEDGSYTFKKNTLLSNKNIKYGIAYYITDENSNISDEEYYNEIIQNLFEGLEKHKILKPL